MRCLPKLYLLLVVLLRFLGQRYCDAPPQNNHAPSIEEGEGEGEVEEEVQNEFIEANMRAWYNSTKQQYPDAEYLKSSVVRGNNYILNSAQLVLANGENRTVVVNLVTKPGAKELWVEIEHNEDYLGDCIGSMEVPQYAVKTEKMTLRLQRGDAVRTTEYYSVKASEYINNTIRGDAVFYFRNNATLSCGVKVNAYVMLHKSQLPANKRTQLSNLYEKCCPSKGCEEYREFQTKVTKTNFCVLPGHHCSNNNNSMTVLDMSDMQLSCALAATDLNEFTDLIKLDFSLNPGLTFTLLELMKIVDNNKDLEIVKVSNTQITGYNCSVLDVLIAGGGSNVIDMDFNRTQVPDELYKCKQFREAFKKIQVINFNGSMVDFHPHSSSSNLTVYQLKAIDLFKHDELRCPRNVSAFDNVPTSALVGLTCHNYYRSIPINSAIAYRNNRSAKGIFYSSYYSHMGTLSLSNNLTNTIRHSHADYSTMRSFEVEEQNFQEIFINFTITDGACDIEVVQPPMAKTVLVGQQRKDSVLKNDVIYMRPDFQIHPETTDIPRGFYKIMVKLSKSQKKCVVEVTISADKKISYASATPTVNFARALQDNCCQKYMSSSCKNWDKIQNLCLLHGMHCNQKGQLTTFDTTQFNFKCQLPFKEMKLVKSLEQIYIEEGSSVTGHYNQFADLIASLPNLKVFKVNGQKVDGEINCKGSFNTTFAKVVDVDFSGNQLTGGLKDCLFSSKTLKRINLSDNKLSGVIPDLSTKQSGLHALLINNNEISGNLQSTLQSSFPSLTELQAAGNSLNGSLPIKLPSQLQTLIVPDNKLTGNLPTEWDRTGGRYLLFVDVSGNPFDPETFVLTQWAIDLIASERMVTEGLQGRWMCPEYITKSTWQRIMLQARKYWDTRCLDTDRNVVQVVSLMSFAVKKMAPADETYMGDLGRWEVEESWQRSLVVEGNIKKALYTFDVNENAKTLIVRAQHMSGQCDISVLEPFISRWYKPEVVSSDHHSQDEVIIIRENQRTNGLRKGTYKLYVQNSLFLPCRLIVSIQLTSAVPELTNESEKQAIVNIYNKCCSTGSSRYYFLYYRFRQTCRDWNDQIRHAGKVDNSNFCSLAGQNCENGRLTILDFDEMNFNCTFEDIKDDLAQFRYLKKLNLNKNTQLAPSYPQFLELVSKLHELNIVWFENVMMAGNITCPSSSPDFSIKTSVFRIVDLRLSQNKLNGTIPGCIFTFADEHLKNIDLSQNQLSGNLPVIAKNIESADLSFNKLEGEKEVLESFFKGAENLQILDLSYNIIKGPLPESLPKQLLKFNIRKNRLQGPISQYWDMFNRREFDASDNSMLEDSEIPQWMAKMILENQEDIKIDRSGELKCPTVSNLTWFYEFEQHKWLNDEFMCEFGESEVSLFDYLNGTYTNLTQSDSRNGELSYPVLEPTTPILESSPQFLDEKSTSQLNTSNQEDVKVLIVVPSVEIYDKDYSPQFTNDTQIQLEQTQKHTDLFLQEQKQEANYKPEQEETSYTTPEVQNQVVQQLHESGLQSKLAVSDSTNQLHGAKIQSWLIVGFIVTSALVLIVGTAFILRKRIFRPKKPQYRDFDEEKMNELQSQRDAIQTRLTNRERPQGAVQLSTLQI